MSGKWLKPDRETPEQKAARQRRAKEQHQSVYDVISQLDAMQAQSPAPAALPKQQRIDPKAIIEGEEPQPISEDHSEPRVIGEPGQPAPPPGPAQAGRAEPDPRLVEIARTWSWLSERDRDELLLLARVKAHLNQKAAGK